MRSELTGPLSLVCAVLLIASATQVAAQTFSASLTGVVTNGIRLRIKTHSV